MNKTKLEESMPFDKDWNMNTKKECYENCQRYYIPTGHTYCLFPNCPCHQVREKGVCQKHYLEGQLSCKCDKIREENVCPYRKCLYKQVNGKVVDCIPCDKCREKPDEGWEGETKVCSFCNEVKDYSEFHKSKRSVGGVNSCCKECKLKKDKGIFEKSREKRLHQMDEHYQNNKESYFERNKRMEEIYPEKHKAREITSNAIFQGKLIKRPCEFCGEVEVQAHHQDYLKPLEVNWLCIKCHKKYHSLIRQLIQQERQKDKPL